MRAERPASAVAAPLLVRRKMLDAVAAAQDALGGRPAPAAAVAKIAPNLGHQARGTTLLLRRIAALGPDESGRTLLELHQRSSTSLWAVVCGPPAPAPAPAPDLQQVEALLAAEARPDEGFPALIARLLAELKQLRAQAAPAQGVAPSSPPAAIQPPMPAQAEPRAPAAAFSPPEPPAVPAPVPLEGVDLVIAQWMSRSEADVEEVLNDK